MFVGWVFHASVPLWVVGFAMITSSIASTAISVYVIARLQYRRKVLLAKQHIDYWFAHGHIDAIRVYVDQNRITGHDESGTFNVPAKGPTYRSLGEEFLARFDPQVIIAAAKMLAGETNRFSITRGHNRTKGKMWELTRRPMKPKPAPKAAPLTSKPGAASPAQDAGRERFLAAS